MAYHIKVGTKLLVKGSIFDDYVIEKITHTSVDGMKRYRIAVRTEGQRCFPGTPQTVWTDTYLLDCLNKGTMQIQD